MNWIKVEKWEDLPHIKVGDEFLIWDGSLWAVKWREGYKEIWDGYCCGSSWIEKDFMNDEYECYYALIEPPKDVKL